MEMNGYYPSRRQQGHWNAISLIWNRNGLVIKMICSISIVKWYTYWVKQGRRGIYRKNKQKTQDHVKFVWRVAGYQRNGIKNTKKTHPYWSPASVSDLSGLGVIGGVVAVEYRKRYLLLPLQVEMRLIWITRLDQPSPRKTFISLFLLSCFLVAP